VRNSKEVVGKARIVGTREDIVAKLLAEIAKIAASVKQ
jgi:hypothetical protein